MAEQDFLSDSESSLSSMTRELGINNSYNTSARYVIHSSTIPLASTMYVEPMFMDPVKRAHYCSECLYGATRTGTVRSSCVCTDLPEREEVCFLSFMKNYGKYYEYGASMDTPLDQYSICYDTVAVGDSKYPQDVKRFLSLDGWRKDFSIDDCRKVLSSLYWYSRDKTLEGKVRKLFEKFSERAPGMILRHITFIDNHIMKVCVGLPSYIGDYKWFAKGTAIMFGCLLDDDLKDRCVQYDAYKDFGNMIKSRFNSTSPDVRMEVFQANLRQEIFSLYQKPWKAYESKVIDYFQDHFEDITDSLEWRRVMTILLQNRMMELPPDAYVEREIKQFLSKLEEEDTTTPPKDAALIVHQAVARYKLPERLLENKEDDRGENLRNMISESVRIDMKTTASYEFTRTQGGKLENARILISDFFRLGKSVRIYDLGNPRVIGTIHPSMYEKDDVTHHPEIVFWISFQMLLNSLGKYDPRFKIFHYEILYEEGIPHRFEDNIFKMKTEFIKEPGKLRGLSKTSAVLYWALTPMMAVLNSALALLPEHYDGLKRGAHGWRYSKRLASRSQEGANLYDEKGNIRPSFFHYYSDWKEATDFINKKFGISLLIAWGIEIEAPRFYLDICGRTLEKDLSIEFTPDIDLRGLKPFRGTVRRGFMMGLPLTKTILHLCQLYKQEKALYNRPFKETKGRRDRREYKFPIDNIRHFE